jgi:hypothetical protein
MRILSTFLLATSLFTIPLPSERAIGGQECAEGAVSRQNLIWKAWATKEPPGALSVAGVVVAPSPGHVAVLEPAVPQGINPRILILDLKLLPLPGIWPPVLTPIPAVYSKTPYKGEYDSVTVRFPDGSSVDLRVIDAGLKLLAGGEGPRHVQPRIVAKIVDVQLTIEKINPPNLVVKATGQVMTQGYADVRLARVAYVAPPADGIQDYILFATPPSGPAAQMVSLVQASDAWKGYAQAAPWLKGVRVHGIDDGIVVKMLPSP